MALRSSGTCCAVRGCTNNQAKLNMWLQQQCFDHAPQTKRECPCEQRYSFHRLPTDEDSKRVWLRNINLKKPPKTFYVCSFHFVDKKPTDENPHPTLWLGSDRPPEKRRRILGKADSSVTTSGVRVMTSPQKMDHQGSPVRFNESAATVLPSFPSSSRLAEGSSSSSSDHQTTSKPLWAPLETDAPITLDTSDEVHVCQLCGCWYETRKGLSSHARAHLRQIGIPDSDIKGRPIDFLYQIMEDEDLKPVSSGQQKPLTSDSPPKSSSKHPSDLTSPSGSPPSKRLKLSKECICILCGKECENRKGLSSHYSAHLRQIGITDLMGKTSVFQAVLELVNSGILEAAFSPKTNTASSSSAVLSTPPTCPVAPPLSPSRGQSQSPVRSPQSSPSPLNRAPKAKKGFRLAVDPLHRKPKPEPVEIDVSFQPEASNNNSNSPQQKSPSAPAASKSFSAVSSPKNRQSPLTVLCDFCGQLFETRKALSCHVRAHLRQLGLTWSIKTSPIDLLREVMLHSEEGKKGSSAAGKATWSPPGSNRPLDSPQAMETASDSCTTPLDYSMKEKSQFGKCGSSHPYASCELCGFNFENRKALASHARAHLRQLGIIEWRADGASSPIELLSELIRKDPVKVAAITERYRMGELFIKKSQRSAASPSLSTDSDTMLGSSLKADHKTGREDALIIAGSSRQSHSHTRTIAAHSNPCVRTPRGVHLPKHALPMRGESHGNSSRQPPRSGSIPALLPRPPLTPLVKLVGKVYSLKCRFCEEVFHGPLSVQEQWITHLQKHILTLGYKGKASPPAAPVAAPALVHPVAV